MRRRGVAAVVTIGMLVSIVGLGFAVTSASHTDTPDRNDTEGRFDVRAVHLDHYPQPMTWTFRTFSGWTIDQVWDRGFFVLELDTRGDQDIDERILVRSDGRTLEGVLITIRSDGPERIRTRLHASKDGSRSASVEVALRRLGIGGSRELFRWNAYSIFTGPECRRVCVDRVPDQGSLEHLVPGASPSPSPSPSPTSPTGATGAS